MSFFLTFFYILVVSSFSLFFFDKGSNQFLPLLIIVVSLISFEVVNLFYNLSLHKVSNKNEEGLISNLGWGFGYLGGLISLLIVFSFIQLTKHYEYQILGISVFLLVGPFVGIWTLIFGYMHLRDFIKTVFDIPTLIDFFKNVKDENLLNFVYSYFFFNNAVVSIFAFAGMFASFLFGLTESDILFLGVFINLFGIVGCFSLGRIEDKIGSRRIISICIISLFICTISLYFVRNVLIFWIIALIIGFFIGPIQASSRSVIAKHIKSKNQISAFCAFSMFGNMCAILGPFFVGFVIRLTNDVQYGLLIIPLFLGLSIFPSLIRGKFNV
jgi:UMF1 family MFS transporter